ncbi:hypothetical protein [Sulfuriroseicoccus oceanibius]|uniref:Type II secretion system protein n=1 Tax=Sulfuriroseicoccus oceanibius TaxID=2707525 RepID=A0A6B3L6H5_9BACT|nr:hypothetical protein [Sulfuriroseicoccus oceanibius]QQL44816.1 hypothetical protein G3M56_013190 [Sulfuriroseicoccus oceanibius]
MRNPESRAVERRRGYMLLEAMFALAIFVIAVTSMVKALNGMARNFQDGAGEVEVAQLMDSAMAEALALPSDWMTEDGWEAQREFDGRFTVNTAILPTEVSNDEGNVLTGFFGVRVEVVEIETGERWSVESLRYIPELASAVTSGGGGR